MKRSGFRIKWWRVALLIILKMENWRIAGCFFIFSNRCFSYYRYFLHRMAYCLIAPFLSKEILTSPTRRLAFVYVLLV
ncbi:hypothetical protein B379_14145 [Anoxybacillus ayderensis G10]|nr:hypothetical protein B379_14145 [Anoxybacillus ayderensis G10]